MLSSFIYAKSWYYLLIQKLKKCLRPKSISASKSLIKGILGYGLVFLILLYKMACLSGGEESPAYRD